MKKEDITAIINIGSIILLILQVIFVLHGKIQVSVFMAIFISINGMIVSNINQKKKNNNKGCDKCKIPR